MAPPDRSQPTPDAVAARCHAALRDEAGVTGAWLFGSGARGGLRPDSDLDLALRFGSDECRLAHAADPLAMMGRLGLRLGRDVQLVDLTAAPLSLRMQVFRHGIELFDDEPGATKALLIASLLEWFDQAPLRRVAREAMAMRLARRPRGSAGGGHG